MSKRPRITSDETPLTQNPFASLLGEVEVPETSDGGEADAAHATPDPPTPPSSPRGSLDLSSRLVVRRQKKGHGGKTVTFIEGLAPESAAQLLPRLKRELGCRARMDETSVQGVLIAGTKDHKRVAEWLKSAGASKVVLGN